MGDSGETDKHDTVDEHNSGDDHVPIESQALLIAAAKASVSGGRLPTLIDRVQTLLDDEIDQYERRFECVKRDDERAIFLVDIDHWDSIGERLGFEQRETDAVRRAHVQQLLRCGSTEGRREEFETAIEIRDAVVIGY